MTPSNLHTLLVFSGKFREAISDILDIAVEEYDEAA
jgi:hypothetical protein